MGRTGKRTAGLLIIGTGIVILLARMQVVDSWMIFGYAWIAAIVILLAELWFDQKKRFYEEERVRVHKPSIVFIVLFTGASLLASNLGGITSGAGVAFSGTIEESEPYYKKFEIQDSVEDLSFTITNASLTIYPHAEKELVIDGEIKGSGIGLKGLTERFEERLHVTESGHEMKVTHDRGHGFSFPVIGRQLKLEADIYVPEDLYVKVDVVNGSIHTYDLKGILEASIVNGPVTVSGQKDDVQVSTTNGRIVIHDTVGDVTAAATNGDIRLSDVDAEVSAETVNGSITVESFSQNGDWMLETVNGSVTVRIPHESDVLFEGNTTNGSVTGDVDFERAYSGHAIREKRQGAKEIGNGLWQIHAKSVNGSIRLHLE